MVLGAPNTYPEYGDIQTAWAPSKKGREAEFLYLSFEKVQYVNKIEIYETFNPGSVVSVHLRNIETGEWVPAYRGKVENDLPAKSRIKTIDIPLTEYLVDAVKIIMYTRQVDGWNEIDAVSITGFPFDDE